MNIASIIVAAGRGTRAGGGMPKQWREVAGKPVARWTLEGFAPYGPVLVIHPDDEDAARAACGTFAPPLVHGAPTRCGSVRAGLEALAGDPPDIVLIHDVARCCTPRHVIDAVVAALLTHDAAAPALPVTDALWTGASGMVTGVQDRSGLYRAQTPQGFRFDAILAAHRAFDGDAADDVAVARAAGLDVAIVPGHEDNFKITGPDDFARASMSRERQDGHQAGQRL